MDESGKPKTDGLKRWLIIDTVLSPIILIVLNLFFLILKTLGGLFPYFYVGVAALIGTIIASWVYYKRGIRKKARTWSYLALSTSLLPAILFRLHLWYYKIFYLPRDFWVFSTFDKIISILVIAALFIVVFRFLSRRFRGKKNNEEYENNEG